MLKRGIKDFAYRVYDRELVVLESDWQNGQHETLSQGFNLMLRSCHDLAKKNCYLHKTPIENLS